MRSRLAAILLTALAFPGMARAECLGDGCYDGLLLIVILVVLGGLALLALFIWLIVGAIRGPRSKRRP